MQKEETPFASPIKNHRSREKGVLVYPVYSRRSGGLSLGINLFPDKKRCSFSCPYCEVFPFSTNAEFSLVEMEEDLREAITTALEGSIKIKDICFSGNGEPTMSPDFPNALECASRMRTLLVPDADLVLITNGMGLLEDGVFSLLREAAISHRLDIWLKFDAGTPAWFAKMNRPRISPGKNKLEEENREVNPEAVLLHEKIIARLKEFSAFAPFTIQTMLCAVDGEGPPPFEEAAWENLIVELAAIARKAGGRGLNKVQIYGKARPAPEDPKAAALPAVRLLERADSLHAALAASIAAEKSTAGIDGFETPGDAVIPVEIYP